MQETQRQTLKILKETWNKHKETQNYQWNVYDYKTTSNGHTTYAKDTKQETNNLKITKRSAVH